MKKRTFTQLNIGKRDRLFTMNDGKTLQKDIAKALKVGPSTISRELTRNRKKGGGTYEPEYAQERADERRKLASYKGRKIENNPELKKRIIKELKEKRSPDEIAGRMKKEKLGVRVGKDAIYDWLYSVWGLRYCKYLCTKRYKPKPHTKKTKREMIPNRTPLSKRTKTKNGKRLVHAEGDTFVSPQKLKTQESGALVCVKDTQLLLGRKVSDLRAVTMEQAINEICDDATFDTLTFDNGRENRNHESFPVPSYFCDPHAPWQKPHVECNIGLLRRWFIKKGTDLREVSEEELQSHLNVLNHKYRKSLGYKSAYEVSLERGIINEIPPRVLLV